MTTLTKATPVILCTLSLIACGGSSSDPDDPSVQQAPENQSLDSENLTGVWLLQAETDYEYETETEYYDESGEISETLERDESRSSQHQYFIFIIDDGINPPKGLWCDDAMTIEDPTQVTLREFVETDTGYNWVLEDIDTDDGAGNTNNSQWIYHLSVTDNELLEGNITYTSSTTSTTDDLFSTSEKSGNGTITFEKVSDFPGDYLTGSFTSLGRIAYSYHSSDETTISDTDELFCIAAYTRTATITDERTDINGSVTTETYPNDYTYTFIWGGKTEIEYYDYHAYEYPRTVSSGLMDSANNIDVEFYEEEGSSEDTVEYSFTGEELGTLTLDSIKADESESIETTTSTDVKFPAF